VYLITSDESFVRLWEQHKAGARYNFLLHYRQGQAILFSGPLYSLGSQYFHFYAHREPDET
jgi:hypothetical protein